MSYMLDTNICIYLMKHNLTVLGKFLELKENNISISTITLAELEFGICNSIAYEKNRAKLLSLLPLIKIQSFDDLAAVEYGIIRADLKKRGKIIGQLDMLIAAHAKSRNLTLVTNNTGEFERIEGLTLDNWLAA